MICFQLRSGGEARNVKVKLPQPDFQRAGLNFKKKMSRPSRIIVSKFQDDLFRK